MPPESVILENQLYCLKKTYEEHQLIAQRYRIEYERTKRRLRELTELTELTGASCPIKSPIDLCDT